MKNFEIYYLAQFGKARHLGEELTLLGMKLFYLSCVLLTFLGICNGQTHSRWKKQAIAKAGNALAEETLEAKRQEEEAVK